MNKCFQIGDFCFGVQFQDRMPVPGNFLQFETEQGEPEYFYRLNLTDKITKPVGEKIAERSDLSVYQTSAGENRLIGLMGVKEPYACYQERSEQTAEVCASISARNILLCDPAFVSLFALERRMIRQESLILHCAYMEHQGKAILFSAPSGTGKSTQAVLWERYRGSHTVNGDRALLKKIDGRWTACGWPVCGSSKECNVINTPVCAIVMLKQGKTNQVERLSLFQAFTLLYSQITINQWNKAFVQQAISEIEDLISQVPVWQLTCDISENAVKCLETALFPDRGRVNEV